MMSGVCGNTAAAAPSDANYDESKVPPYVLPDPLVDTSGGAVTTVEEWRSGRRPEILRQFEENVYGRAPKTVPKVEFDVASESADALGGKAIRKDVAIHVLPRSAGVTLHLLLYIPKSDARVPAFLGLNFAGNQAVHTDPEIALAKAWVLDNPKYGIDKNQANEKSRGCEAERWQVEKVVARGYAVGTICCGDIDPDFDDGFRNGVHALFSAPNPNERQGDEWGTIAAWAWGLSRALDYLETEPRIDAKRVAVWGHSRLGKAALWAGACDERFALVISNNSGCGGAALNRRIFGETVGSINKRFPHWFCSNFHTFNDREDQLPVDQHMLVALVAPRPIYIASAAEDLWADPRGEFLSAKHAAPVYSLYGKAGLGVADMPAVDRPVGESIGYHIRTGAHDATAYDWQQYLSFADRHLRANAAPAAGDAPRR
jgi:hypothetical protein